MKKIRKIIAILLILFLHGDFVSMIAARFAGNARLAAWDAYLLYRAWAAEVFYVSTTGSDANSCTAAKTITTPKRNVMGTDGGMKCLAGGDILDIRAGTYSEDFRSHTISPVLPGGTSWANATTIRGHVGETVELSGSIGFSSGTPFSYIIWDNLIMSNGGFFFGSGTDHVRISNGEIKNSTQAGISGSGSFHEVIDVDIHHNGLNCINSPVDVACAGYGIYWGGSDTLFERVTVRDNPAYGYHIFSSGQSNVSRNIVRYGTIYNNGGVQDPMHGGNGTNSTFGLLMSNGTGNQAYGNTIYGNQNGIDIGPSCIDCLAANNTVYANNKLNGLGQLATEKGITNSGTRTIIKNNIIVGEAQNGINDVGTNTVMSNNHCDSAAAGCLTTGDPLFVDVSGSNRDFHLQAGSPAINQAATLTCPGCEIDHDGNVRGPGGTAWEIGALEFGGAPPVTRVLTVASSNPGSGCTATPTPLDVSGAGVGTTQFVRTYLDGTIVSLTAALTCGGNDFQKWQKNAIDETSAANVNVTMNAAYTMTAVYVAPTQPTSVLTIDSVAPASGARISVSPNDNAGLNSVSTSGARTYNTGTVITVTARPTSNAPLVWYPLDENGGTTYGDASSNLNGTCPNAASCSWVAGNGSLSAVNLDGINGFIQVPDSNLFTNLTEWTIAEDFKPAVSMVGSQAVILSKGTILGIYANVPSPTCPVDAPYVFFKHTSGTYYSVCDTATAPVGAWTRTRGLCSGTTLSIMRNGAVTNTAAVPSCAVANDTLPLFLGSSPSGFYFNGAIDNGRIYGVALADDDNPGNPFASWGGTCDNAVGRVCTQTLGGNETITATFAASGVTLTQSAFKIYDLGKNGASVVDITSSAKVMKGGSINVASQIDATGANPPTTTLKQRYNKDGGSYADLPDTPGGDGISWHGTVDTRVSTPPAGDPVAACLSGALTPFSGTTSRTAAGTPSFDIDQDSCIVNRSLVKFETTASGIYCFRHYKQDGTALDSYTATACVTVTDYNSSGI